MFFFFFPAADIKDTLNNSVTAVLVNLLLFLVLLLTCSVTGQSIKCAPQFLQL